MNKLDKDYTELLQDILDNGFRKNDRTRTGTVSVFGRELRHKMSEGFPLITTKKMAWKSMVIELIWFLNGDTNIKYLVDNDCNIWNGDAYKKYEIEFDKGNATGTSTLGKRIGVENKDVKLSKEDMIKNSEEYGCEDFVNKWGDLGPIYGAQWRKWIGARIDEYDEGSYLGSKVNQIDQIATLIDQLKNNPDSRRLMVNAWNPSDLPITDYRSDNELYQDYLKTFE